MANPASPQNTNSRDLDPLIKTSSVIAVKRAVVTRAVAGIDPVVGDVGVATHADDGAFVPGTDPIVVIGGIADETATDSVDEGDAGALRMTLSRKLIGAGDHLDDAAYGVATSYATTIGALADETATDSVDEGDAGALRMTLNRRLITAGQLLDDAAFGVAADYVSAIGALADDTSPDSVTEGDVGAVRMSLARALHVVNVADAAAVTTVNSAATSATLLAANANRIGATFFNTDANNLYLKFGATASTTSFTVKIATGGYYELPSPIYRGIIDGIWDVDGSGLVAITELT